MNDKGFNGFRSGLKRKVGGWSGDGVPGQDSVLVEERSVWQLLQLTRSRATSKKELLKLDRDGLSPKRLLQRDRLESPLSPFSLVECQSFGSVPWNLRLMSKAVPSTTHQPGPTPGAGARNLKTPWEMERQDDQDIWEEENLSPVKLFQNEDECLLPVDLEDVPLSPVKEERKNLSSFRLIARDAQYRRMPGGPEKREGSSTPSRPSTAGVPRSEGSNPLRLFKRNADGSTQLRLLMKESNWPTRLRELKQEKQLTANRPHGLKETQDVSDGYRKLEHGSVGYIKLEHGSDESRKLEHKSGGSNKLDSVSSRSSKPEHGAGGSIKPKHELVGFSKMGSGSGGSSRSERGVEGSCGVRKDLEKLDFANKVREMASVLRTREKGNQLMFEDRECERIDLCLSFDPEAEECHPAALVKTRNL